MSSHEEQIKLNNAKASQCIQLLWDSAQNCGGEGQLNSHRDSKADGPDESPTDSASTSHIYAILDGAKDTKILPLINNSDLEHACLFSGKLSYALRRAAPHLVKLERAKASSEELIHLIWSQNCGIFLLTGQRSSLADIRRHCRRIDNVTSPSGKSLYFRYYDPDILWPMLPVCSLDELKTLFGPVRYFLAPNYDNNATGYKSLFREPHSSQLTKQILENGQALGKSAQFTRFPYTKPFQLRGAHLNVFEKRSDLAFFKRIYKSYRKIYLDNPQKTFLVEKQTLALPAFLWRCYPKGVEYKLENAYHFSVFFHLCSQYGWEFWLQDHCQWAVELLSLPRPAEIRIEKIERKLSARLMESVWS